MEDRELYAARGRLPLALTGNALLRIAGGASGVLVGLYLADLAGRGARIDAALAGVLGAVSFGGELLFAAPAGILADAIGPRTIITAGAILGAFATQLFGMSGWVGIFFLSRAIEGFAAAAGSPPLLAHITDITEHDATLRVRAMSYFELSLLAGLALGGLLGAQLWRALHTQAFAAVAAVYLLCAILLYAGVTGSKGYGRADALAGAWQALARPSVRRLAPLWLCVNSIVGLWLGPTLTFLLTQKAHSNQFLTGIFSDRPERMGWLLLGYACVFGAGVTAWSFIMRRIPVVRVLPIALIAMFAVCGGLLLLNHSAGLPPAARWTIGVGTALCIMVESGFTPAALSLLAQALGAKAGRGAAMGVYSVLLSVGAIVGSLAAAELGRRLEVDGLIYGTAAMAAVAITLLGRLKEASFAG